MAREAVRSRTGGRSTVAGPGVQALRIRLSAPFRDVLKVGLVGAFDQAAVARFDALMRGVVASRARIVIIDLRRCDFPDLAGLGSLLVAGARLEAAGQILLVGYANGQAGRLLARAGAVRVADGLALAPGLFGPSAGWSGLE